MNKFLSGVLLSMTVSDRPEDVPRLVQLSSTAICGSIEVAVNKRNEPVEHRDPSSSPSLVADLIGESFTGNDFQREASEGESLMCSCGDVVPSVRPRLSPYPSPLSCAAEIYKERVRSRQPPRPSPDCQPWHKSLECNRQKLLDIVHQSASSAYCAGTSFNLHINDIQYYSRNLELDVFEKSDSLAEYVIRLACIICTNLRLVRESGLRLEISEYNSAVEERDYNVKGFYPSRILVDENGLLPRLPLPCSQNLYSTFRKMLLDKDSRVQDAVLRLFNDGIALPLHTLDISKMLIDDVRVYTLLKAHALTLVSLNMSGCRRLSPILLRLLRGVHLPLLQKLIIGGCLQIYKSWNRSNSVDSSRDSSTTQLASFEDFKDLVRDATASAIQDEGMEDEVSARDDDDVTIWQHDIEYVFNKLTPIAQLDDVPAFVSAEQFVCGNTLTNCCPNLHTLVIHGCSWDVLNYHPRNIPDFLHMVLSPLHKLRVLDLSYWERLEDLRFLRPIENSLHTLVLYNVPNLIESVPTICELKSLRVLDISQGNSESGAFPRPVNTLQLIVNSLKQLRSLDISSTNLATQASEGDWPDSNLFRTVSDIPGLRPLTEPLLFLGLFNCDAASHYKDIPAINIAGDANERQVLLAMQTYMNRLEILQTVLNETYQIYRFGSELSLHTDSLHAVLEAMDKYCADLSLQIAGSASLFYIIKNVNMTHSTRNKIISALIRGMEIHIAEQVMVRNCCLSLCQFDIPKELLFDYKRAARLLIRVMETHNDDHMTQRIVVFLLNSMACHVEGVQKVTVGELRAIEVILAQIRHKQTEGVCDEVMEVSWSFLWNITDETEVNCFKFLENDGMIAFRQCYESFPTKKKLIRNMMGLLTFPNNTELVRNMMGLVGNIAEVCRLRHFLMESQYIKIFTILLGNLSDGIEISYNSAGVLAHLISDGAEAWNISTPDRSVTSMQLINATKEWPLNAKRFINYRSFGPILRLVDLEDCEASQHWALWALANLTSVDGQKYCHYVINEGGMSKLHKIMDSSNNENLKGLAKIVLGNVEMLNNDSSTEMDISQSDAI